MLFCLTHNPNSQYGDHVFLDVELAFRFLVTVLGLKEKAINSGIEIAITGDGAAITTSSKTAGQCCVGFKMVDSDSINPATNERYFYDKVADNDGVEQMVYKNLQSVNACFPIAICLQRESNAVVRRCFGDIFKWCNAASRNGLPKYGEEPEFAKIRVVACGDMSFLMKLINSGGACKVKKYFCPYCECHGDKNMWNVFEDNKRCKICQYNNRKHCPHRAVNDSDEIGMKGRALLDLLLEDHRRVANDPTLRLQQILPQEPVHCFAGYEGNNIVWTQLVLGSTISEDGLLLERPINDYCRHVMHTEERTSVIQSSRMVYDPNAVEKKTTETNIDYEVKNNGSLSDNAFFGNVLHDLCLRGFVKIPSCKFGRVRLLRSCLKTREYIEQLRDALRLFELSSNDRLFDPGQCPPCILHHNNRTTEKLVQQLLWVGLRHAHDLSNFVASVNTTVNRDIFGRSNMHINDSSGWRVPMTRDGKQLDDINLSNTQARDFVKHFEFLVNICTQNCAVELKDAWQDICRRFRTISTLLDSKQHFHFEDVCAFQKDADEFCSAYFALTGRDGMTNYFHLLHAGHYSYFLLKYGNLYRYSQQGWENVNAVLKRSFHQNSQKGGGKGGSSKLLQVMYRMSRQLMWRVGHLDGLFDHLGYDESLTIDYGKQKVMPKFKHVHWEVLEEYAKSLVKFPSLSDMESSLELVNNDDNGTDIVSI
jgi:hypothetical protein